MQTNVSTVTSQQFTTVTTTFESTRQVTAPKPNPKPVQTAAPAALNQPTLNLPQSAQTQPVNVTTPSYSPQQPRPVEETRANKHTQDEQQALDIKAQQARQPAFVADAHLAANVLTGEYNASAARRVGAPRVGGYLSAVV